MSATLSGGCQCGAVRYRVTLPLEEPHLCHCRMCQKAVGNYFASLASVKQSAFEITRGEPAWFHSSGPVRRSFCRDCGTPLLFETAGFDDISITLGSLDDPASMPPVSASGVEAKMPWIAEAVARDGRASDEDDYLDGQLVRDIAATNRQHPDHDTEVWPMKHHHG